MRVAIISAAPLKGGSESGAAYYTRALAEELFSRGVSAEIWSKRNGQPDISKAPVIPVWRPGWFAWLDIVRALFKRKPDVLHIQDSMFVLGPGLAGEFSMLVLALLLRMLRARVVATQHDIPALGQVNAEWVRMHGYRFPAALVVFGLRMVFSAVASAARVIIVHQESFARILVRDYRIPRSKISVVPHVVVPIAATGFASPRASLGIENGDRVVLFFGFATRYKGIELLLQAFRRLAPGMNLKLLLGAGKHPSLSLTAGYDRYYSSLARDAAEIPGVEFLGFLPDARLGDYIGAADLAVFPYLEFQGMSGPLNLCASRRKPFLVSTRIAEKVADLAACAFEPDSEVLATALGHFFSSPVYREAVESECARFAQSVLQSDPLALTVDAYKRAVSSTSRMRA